MASPGLGWENHSGPPFGEIPRVTGSSSCPRAAVPILQPPFPPRAWVSFLPGHPSENQTFLPRLEVRFQPLSRDSCLPCDIPKSFSFCTAWMHNQSSLCACALLGASHMAFYNLAFSQVSAGFSASRPVTVSRTDSDCWLLGSPAAGASYLSIHGHGVLSP